MQINQPTITTRGGLRPTHVEVNLDRLSQNLKAIRERTSPAKVMIILKANAYGHGMDAVARHLAPHADYIGVAVLEEGVLLREMGITTPVLVLGGIWEEQIPEFIKHDLTLTASSVERLEHIDQAAGVLGKKAVVHLKIDTGMERIGVHYYSAHTLQEAALGCKHVVVEGIYSHFANADAADLTHARLQLERFNEVLRFYERNGLPTPMRHMANSGAILQLPEATFDMVRPGILLYGVYPSPDVPRTVKVRPALAWSSKVVYFKVTKPGHPVSYGSTWQSDRMVRVVTVPVGYGDGYFRSMSNKAQVIIRGVKYPQVGRICMDQMVVNLGRDGTGYNGDKVVLIGEMDGERITVEDLADWAGTIPYEILTNINTRVPRVYVTAP
ncbi:MAG: alanine racemase [Chloroflexi bacterium]|nr:alanine racemase [Chloroflexota bacterium]